MTRRDNRISMQTKSTSSSVDATDVECPTCDTWVGWACKGKNYGYHAAGYHPARERAAAAKKIDAPAEIP